MTHRRSRHRHLSCRTGRRPTGLPSHSGCEPAHVLGTLLQPAAPGCCATGSAAVWTTGSLVRSSPPASCPSAGVSR